MQIFQLLATISSQLEALYERSAAQVVAWTIIQEITKKSRAQLLVEKEIEFTKEQKKNLRTIVDRHVVQHEPLAYILGSIPFLDLTLITRAPVLIPRPETEEWTFKLISQIKKVVSLQEQKDLTILDLCTGSGCIGLALAQAFPAARITAVDKAEHALSLARENARKNDIKNIDFFWGDLFEPLPPTKKYDLIVANPPYIDHREWETVELSVKKWEDYNALVAEEHGMRLIKKIIQEAPVFLHSSSPLAKCGIKQLWIEIGYNQGETALDFCKNSGYSNAQIIQDSLHINRVIRGTPDYAHSKCSLFRKDTVQDQKRD